MPTMGMKLIQNTSKVHGIFEGSLEIKPPIMWTNEKQMGRAREEKRRRKIKEEKFERKKMQVREKVENSRNTLFF